MHDEERRGDFADLARAARRRVMLRDLRRLRLKVAAARSAVAGGDTQLAERIVEDLRDALAEFTRAHGAKLWP